MARPRGPRKWSPSVWLCRSPERCHAGCPTGRGSGAPNPTNEAAKQRVVVVVLPLSMQGPRTRSPEPCTTPAADSPRGQKAPGQCPLLEASTSRIQRHRHGTRSRALEKNPRIGSRAGPAIRKITTTMGGCTFQILSHVTCVRRRRPCLHSRPGYMAGDRCMRAREGRDLRPSAPRQGDGGRRRRIYAVLAQ